MSRHIVTQDEFDDWLRRPQWQTFASSFSVDSNKTFEIDGAAHGWMFRVTDHGETVFLGCDKAAAIAAYNKAR